jgi:hypothetical protein
MHARVLSSSVDRSRPTGGCRPRSSSSASFASRSSKSISYRQRRGLYSSNVQLRAVSYLRPEQEAHTWEEKSRQTASFSMLTSPSACAKAFSPSSHAKMVLSPLSSSLSQARSCSCNSMITACEGDEALRQSESKSRCHDEEASPSKHRHRLKTHLAGDDA